jgi:hypothetical protein
MDSDKKNLIILFPGRGYGNNHPLLYYARFKYEAMGYECVSIEYGDAFIAGKTIDEINNIVYK